MDQNLANAIREKALEIGFLDCGIVPLEKALDGYKEYLDERYRRFPDDREFKAADNYAMAEPEKKYPWAQSVVICTIKIGDYILPEEYRHRIARLYAFDYRHEKDAMEYSWGRQLEDFITSLGLKYASSPDRGLVPYRHVAQKAGLGIFRRNNFLYTKEYGSYVSLSAWLIDRPLELTRPCDVPPCPAGCRRCMDACPTGSLEAPYTMHRRTCVSPITTKLPEGDDVTVSDIGLKLDGWLYGCDACQEACPFNQKVLKKKGVRQFPRQEEFIPYMNPEIILSLSEEFLEKHFRPRFWYMPKGSTWKWKVSAMCALYRERGKEAMDLIRPFLADENEYLRKTAEWLVEKSGK